MKAIILLALVFAMGLNASAAGSPSEPTAPAKISQSQADSIAAELQVDPVDYEQYRDEVNRRLSEIGNLTTDDVDATEVSVPDYKPAREALLKDIALAIGDYFATLEAINQKIKVVYSRLKGLQDVAESDTTGIFKMALNQEVQNTIPPLQAEIQKLYRQALSELYLLKGGDGSSLKDSPGVLIPMKYGLEDHGRLYRLYLQSGDAPGFDSHTTLRGEAADTAEAAAQNMVRTTTFRGCQTSACTRFLTRDLMQWYEFVGVFNQAVDLKGVKPQTFTFPTRAVKSRFLSSAILRASQKILTGPVDNKAYTLPSYISRLLAEPAGVVVAVASFPVFVFEKIGAFAGGFNTSLIRVSLRLEKLDAESPKAIGKALSRHVQILSQTLPTVIFIDRSKIKN